MCSIFNDDVENVASNGYEMNNITAEKKVCKCGSIEVVLTLTLSGAFCRECFIQRVAHKFRSEFGKSRLIRDNEEVAVAFSGGRKSTVMVNLVKEGLSKRAQKKLRFSPTLIHIVEPKQWESSYIHDPEIIRMLFTSDMPFFVFGLNQIFEESLVPILSDKDNPDEISQDVFSKKLDFSKLFALRKSLKQTTSMESMHSLLRKELLLRICRVLGLSKVLTGDTASQLAVRLISFVSQGRGGQLSYEMEFADTRNIDVVFVKPMRTFLEEEIDTLIGQKNLPFVEKPAEKWEIQTINSLTENFIEKLQMENDKTLSIICRTGEKLTATQDKSDVSADSMLCCLCRAPLESNGSKLTANSAADVSASIADGLKIGAGGDAMVRATKNLHLESKSCGGSGCCGSGCCGSEEKICCSSQVSLLSKEDASTCLCYACRILVKDMVYMNP